MAQGEVRTRHVRNVSRWRSAAVAPMVRLATRHASGSRLGAIAAVLIAAFALAACTATNPGGWSTAPGERLRVLASFYPLQFVAQQVGGEYVDVINLTPPAAEPHDLELSLAQARRIATADVVILLGGFQAAVDEAVEQQQPARVVDAAHLVTLVPGTQTGIMAEEDDDGPVLGAEYDGEHEHGDGHEHGALDGYDPHFWLDPAKLAQLADPVADAFADADPAHAEQFRQNAASLQERLAALDAEFSEQLGPFRGSLLLTNHTAFGYLARRYGLNQVGIAGLDPETEPSPARMREIADLAREHGVSTLFYESLVNPRVVQTLADDLGIGVAELNPIEGITDPQRAAGEDYFTVMRANLATLVAGLDRP